MPESPYNMTTLSRVKTMLKITGTDDDDILQQLISQVSAEIKEYLCRNIHRRTYTEIKSGDGTCKIMLDNFPIHSITSIKYDSDGDHDFSDETAEDSDDYDYDPNTGIIYTDFTFIKGIRNWEIVYIAGYQDFIIVEGINDKLDFKFVPEYEEIDATATLTAGTYTGDELATEVDTQMTTASAEAYENGMTFTVTYNEVDGKFTITSSGYITLEPFEGDNVAQTAGDILGFSRAITHETEALIWTSDLSVWGIPLDIVSVANKLVILDYEDSGYGRHQSIGLESKSAPLADSSLSFDKDVRKRILKQINRHKEIFI